MRRMAPGALRLPERRALFAIVPPQGNKNIMYRIAQFALAAHDLEDYYA
jgi:hypothetical protein